MEMSGATFLLGDACFENVEALDCQLACVAQKSGSLQLAIGLGLEALARANGYAQLGFSSLNAYSLERCERSASWAREARVLAVRVSELPLLRDALLSGRISWSMAGEVARVAMPADEAQWLQICGQCTVKGFRKLAAEIRSDAPPPAGESDDAAGNDPCLLTLTVDREDTWLHECVKRLHRHMVGGSVSEFVEALVFEGMSTMREFLPRDAKDSEDLVPSYDAQNAWNRQLARYREEAEALVDRRVSSHRTSGLPSELLAEEYDFEGPPESIDRTLRQICGRLAERDLLIGELAERFWKADGWRRLGYATARQYARERLGLSLSSVKDRRQLAARLSRLPSLKRTLCEGHIGYEAARLVAGVATPETDGAWAERARRRTLVHLKEEVEAAELLSRVGRRDVIEPPSESIVTELRALETAIVTGAVFRQDAPSVLEAKETHTFDTKSENAAGAQEYDQPAPSSSQQSAAAGADIATAQADVAALWKAFYDARHAPRHLRSRGRVTLRLRVRPDIRALYRSVERQYELYRRSRPAFFRFLCVNFIETWAHELPAVAYADIYARDGLRCTCPVCGRRDVQPHHVTFRSRGGGDEPQNVTSLCRYCHLDGVHEQRIVVSGEAPGALTWRIGRHTTVVGRERVRTT